ncbi:MAG: AMP-binding protein, partial [Verrucomicrobiota bacterium]
EDVVKERESAGAELPDLKLWIVSGGPLRIHTARRFQTLFGNSTLHFGYSALETTGIATSYDIAELPTEAVVVPVGKPLANTKMRVVDSRDHDAPIGIPGEVWIGGDSLARGYLHHVDQTSELFPSEAAEGGGEQRWFRTGNIGRYLPSGDVEIIGKFEDAIEIDGVRGHRAEIERILRAHPEVDRAAVRVMRTSGQTNLAAYVTPALMTRPPRENDLRPFLKERLPLELVPETFSTIPSFPRTLTDQIDWNRMPEPKTRASAAAGAPGDSAKPRKAAAELEKELAALWGELLGGIPASYDTDLFELGGTSETVIALTLALSRHHQHRVSVQAVLDNSTIRKLAAYLQDHHDSEASWTPVVNVRLAGDGAPLFLIHDVGPGSLGAFNRLADELNPSRPVYGMMSRAVSGFGEYANVESLATAYVEKLRESVPAGPVFLGGFYFGGRIAMEMARQMKANEDEVNVPLVVLLDSHPHGGGGLKRAFGRGAAPDPGPPADISPVFDLDPCSERYRKVVEGQIMIRDRFSDVTYDGKVALLTPQIDPILPAHSLDYGWWKFAEGDLDVVKVPCGGDLRRSPEAIAGQLGNLLHINEP